MGFNLTRRGRMRIGHLLRVTFFLLSTLCIVDANPICDDNRYGTPRSTDCILAMSVMVPQDKAIRFFVEEQMRTSPQYPGWRGFKNTSPASAQEKIIQLPKWVSRGTDTFHACKSAGLVCQYGVLLMSGERHMQRCHL